jgi:hypothetical protein
MARRSHDLHPLAAVQPTHVLAATPPPSLKEKEAIEYRPPREDINAPDLYIGVMAFVTYVVVVAADLAPKQEFHPQILGMTASTAFFAILFEILLIRLGLYLFTITPSAPLLDLLCFAGYKFVTIVTFRTLMIFSPPAVYWIMIGYLSLAIAFFTLRNMRSVIFPEAMHMSSTMHIPHRRRRINFLAAIVGVQVLTMWFLAKT